ncbi:hypothetical protein CYK37_10025 [Mesorhizobium loti]|nr:methyltransferase domain-containing protein [Mesorhizobium loti]PLP59636.1 hypothetical protein CYK37_10025 [Mesorhizobium loti]
MTTERAPVNNRAGIVGWLDRTFYADVQDWWDDKAFRAFILQRLQPHHELLDLGAGAGIVVEMNFKDHAKRVCGLDPDPRVVDNPYLHEAQVGLGEHIPWPDGTFDIVVADNVLEHLENPTAVFREVARVLKPGGRFLFKTPNRRHYMPLIARLTPLGFHRFYNRLRGRASEDTFPTVYKANRPADVEAAARPAGMELTAVELIESRPEYLRITAISYMAGILYERLVNMGSALASLRVLLIGELTKK